MSDQEKSDNYQINYQTIIKSDNYQIRKNQTMKEMLDTGLCQI